MGPFLPNKRAATVARLADEKRRRLERRSTEEQVHRSVKHFLPNVTEVQLTQHIVGGKNLLQRLTDDRREARKEGRRLGASYWKAVRLQYGIEDPTGTLIVRDETETIDSGLFGALQQARNPNAALRSKNLLNSWRSSASKVNQKMIVGIVKFMMTLKPDKNAAAAQAMGRGRWKGRGGSMF